MKGLRALAAAAVLSIGMAVAGATGVNGYLDLYVDALTSAKANLEVQADVDRVDKALAKLETASETSVTKNVGTVTATVKLLGPLATSEVVAPAVNGAVTQTWAQVAGRGLRSGAATSAYLQAHFSLSVAQRIGKVNASIAANLTKLNNANSSETMTPAQKLKVFAKVSKAYDKIIKKYERD